MLRMAVTVVFGVLCSLQLVVRASAQPLPVPIPRHVDPLFQNLTIPPDAHDKGMWAPPLNSQLNEQNWPLIAMHMSVMPDGKVVTFGSPINTFDILAEVFDVWNPRRGFTAVGHRTLANFPQVDSFCAASVLLSTGELFTSGGNKGQSVQPTWNTGFSVLNTIRNTVGGGHVPSLASPRYYATQTVLPDGRVLISGGSWAGGPATWGWVNPSAHTNQVSVTPEVYTLGIGSSSLMGATSHAAFGADENRWWYPRQWVAPDGYVFGFSGRQMWYLDVNFTHANGAKGLLTLTTALSNDAFGDPVMRPNIGATSTAVMFDRGKILQLGGNGRANGDDYWPHDWTDSSPWGTVIDINLSSSNPQLSPTTPMTNGRQWANATVLPNGHVLVTGGTKKGNSNAESDVVRVPEIWNPTTNAWTIGAPASEIRVYHSTAALLTNGTVLTAGSGGPPNYWTPSPARFNAEVYYPPYLFQASGGSAILAQRPRILSMNARKFNHGDTIQAEFQSGHTIAQVALVGLGSATHGFDMGQRFYPYSPSSSPWFTVSGTRVSMTAPGPTYTPPGYYMLFVTNSNGVPSEGVIVAIGSQVTPPPLHHKKVAVDWDGDRRSDLTIFRPATREFWVRYTDDGDWDTFEWGDPNSADVPRIIDWDGDDMGDITVWRPASGDWYIRTSSTGYHPDSHTLVQWGSASDIPVPADYDADGRTDVAVWRPSNGVWYIKFAPGTSTVQYQWGGAGDVPRPIDWDGDGLMDFAVFRPSTAMWYVLQSSNGYNYSAYHSLAWGDPGSADVPIPADYDGDGRTDLAIWRPSTREWWIKYTGTTGWSTIMWGLSEDLPRPIDYDGDGAADLAVWKPGTREWYILTSSSNYSSYAVVQWGLPGDIPLGDNF